MSHRHPCSPSLTRRQLLQAGGAAALAMGVPGTVAASVDAERGLRGVAAEKSCIFVLLCGGPSHLDTWDLKPDAPDDIRGPYRPIATSAPGVHICELLPRLARLANRYCIVRSMTHGNGGHDGGMHICMTGHSLPKENTPYFGSVMAKLRPAMPR